MAKKKAATFVVAFLLDCTPYRAFFNIVLKKLFGTSSKRIGSSLSNSIQYGTELVCNVMTCSLYDLKLRKLSPSATLSFVSLNTIPSATASRTFVNKSKSRFSIVPNMSNIAFLAIGFGSLNRTTKITLFSIRCTPKHNFFQLFSFFFC